MKLYGYANAPNPRRVMIFIAEKGLEVELVEVDMLKGAHKTPEFLQKNPSGKLPVLETDDGRFLAESVAICRYLEALHPEPNLFGTDAFELGHIEMRNRQMELELLSPIGTSWVNGPIVAKMGLFESVPEAKVVSDKNVAKYYARLDKEFVTSDYVAGARFTIADITLVAAIDFARTLVGLPPDASLTNLWRWHALVSSRPSVNSMDANSVKLQ